MHDNVAEPFYQSICVKAKTLPRLSLSLCCLESLIRKEMSQELTILYSDILQKLQGGKQDRAENMHVEA